MTTLNTRALALAFGVTWASGILVLGLAARLIGLGVPMVGLFGSVYLGFAPTFTGTAIGTLWAFVDGAIAGAIIALVYNCASKCCAAKDAKPD
ncbi:MAG: hypothetical protein ACI82H_001669 [Alphaproteobacteria bacterium]|jgi:hypothetical protein